MARHVLSGETEHRKDARLLLRAFPHGRNQLHVLPHSDRKAARRMGGGNAGVVLVHAESAATDHARFETSTLRGFASDVLPDRADAGPEAGDVAVSATAYPQKRRTRTRRFCRSAAGGNASRVRISPRLMVRR